MASDFDNEMETPTFGTLAKLAENIVYRAPGCSDLMVRKLIREVARDFCRRSCCLRTKRRILTERGVVDYPVLPVYGGVVDRVVDVSVGRRQFRQGFDYEVRPGIPVTLCFPRKSFMDQSDGCASIVVETVELPELESEKTPAWFIDKHGEDVCTGVLFRLHTMTNRMWSDPQMASKEMIAYENAVGFAAADGAEGGQYGCQIADNPLASGLL